MKQLFSYRLDGDKRIYEGDAFVTRRIDDADAARLDEIDKRYDELDTMMDQEEPTKLFTPLQYLLIACGVVIIGLMIYLNSTFGSIDKGFEESPILTGVLAFACLAGVVITVIDKKKRKEEGTPTDPIHDETMALIEEEDKLIQKTYEALGIPMKEEALDILTPPADEPLDTLSLVDTVFLTVLFENDTLALTDGRLRYEIKKSAFSTITHSNRPITITDPLNADEKEYKKAYGIKETDEGYLIPSYDLFTVTTDHGDYVLALPCYDGKRLAELVGLDY